MTTQRQLRRRKAGRQARRLVPSPVRSCWEFWHPIPNPDMDQGHEGWVEVPMSLQLPQTPDPELMAAMVKAMEGGNLAIGRLLSAAYGSAYGADPGVPGE